MSYLFIGIFLSLIAYLVYFNVTQKETYLSDSHNTRQKDYAEKVIRGSIIAAVGSIAAGVSLVMLPTIIEGLFGAGA